MPLYAGFVVLGASAAIARLRTRIDGMAGIEVIVFEMSSERIFAFAHDRR